MEGIWEFPEDLHPTEDLERVLLLNTEIENLIGIGLPEECVDEIRAELARREDEGPIEENLEEMRRELGEETE